MTKNEFYDKIFGKLSNVEITLLNPNIYMNPKYIDYYMDYNSGRYRKCYEFLMNNRWLLTIEHTPKSFREAVKIQLRQFENK